MAGRVVGGNRRGVIQGARRPWGKEGKSRVRGASEGCDGAQ